MKRNFTVIDLFCGAGGFSYGFKKNNFKILLGIDNNEDAIETYKHNIKAKTLLYDINNLNLKILKKNINSKCVDVLIAGLPCRPYSRANKKIREEQHHEGNLYKKLVEFINGLKPKIFLIENVPEFVSNGKSKAYNYLINILNNFIINYNIIDLADYGLPQHRKRVIIYGINKQLSNTNFNFPKPIINNKNYVKVEEIFKNLPKPCSHHNLHNHYAVNIEENTQKNIINIPPGGNYKNIPNLSQKKYHENYYYKLDPLKPSKTLTSSVYKSHFSHPYCNRILTVRECASLQGFPIDYEFKSNTDSIISMYNQVINAVPPIFSEIIAKNVFDFLSINI
ncbi:DNA cytosine methyltransferase [Caloramator sp. CAR-1]|uniref:DNA cytosine methyltransferase n=1 Tax=Caloramator sp. CAR-1 TaxID=3062777 RepID=UPI0026E25521|nr:DNA cytosine methyltransferase [Caloramator sp. CAR-1]MDO6354851.1 DNA cytosine methyltransferase [Caloramator sp. CAR-1]